MLWTDGDFVTLADLLSIDSEITDIASAEALVIEGNAGLIRRGLEEAGHNLQRHLCLDSLSVVSLTSRDASYPGLSQQQVYGSLAQVIVSGESEYHWSAVKRYALSKVLIQIYRAAIARHNGSDRYADRCDAVKEDIRCIHWPNLKIVGIPILFNPLAAPGATMMRAGSFSTSNLSLVNGSGLAVVEYQFAITWVGAGYVGPSAKNNAESYRSATANLTMVAGKVAKVSITGLTAPDANQPTWLRANSRYNPMAATGWNLWAGLPGEAMYRQNATPLPLVTTDYTLAGDPVLTGEMLDFGQSADVNILINNEIVRG